jgi:hypothetical protein
MKATIEINLNNDAFVQDPLELAQVLRNLANDIEFINGVSLGTFIGIMDINGNSVGSLEVVGEADDETTLIEPDESVKRYQKTQEFFNDTETKETKQWW